MDLNKLSKQAKRIVDQRGGMESLKQDANELKEIAGQPGSLREKAKAAAAALKNPGATAEADTTAAPTQAATSAAPTEAASTAPPTEAASTAAPTETGDQPS